MPAPSSPGFYPSSPNAYPSGPDIRSGSDSGHGTESITVDVSWYLYDSGHGAEEVYGSFSEGTFSERTITDFGTGSSVVTVAIMRPTLFPPPGPAIPQTPLPENRLLLADTRTGRIHFELPYTKLSWNLKINDTGTATATIPLEATLDSLSRQGVDNPARVIWGFITGPNRYTVVVAYGNAVLWAGPLNPTDEVPSDPSIDIGATELPTLFSSRLLVRLDGTGTWSDPSRDVSFVQTNPRGLMYQMVQFGVSKGIGYELPIVCSQPPDLVGTTNYTYLSYDQVDVLKALQTQAAGEDGPDFRFDPFLYDGVDGEYLAYDLRIGDPYLDFGSLWTFDDSTSQVTVSGDALGMSSMLFASGSGQDRDKLIGAAASYDFVNLGFPAMETTDGTMNAETDLDVLTSYATSTITASRSPTLTWSVKALRDGTPQAGQYRIGDLAAVDVREHRLIDPGVYGSRIIEIDGDESPWITSILSMTEADGTGTVTPLVTTPNPIVIGTPSTPSGGSGGVVTSKVKDLTGTAESDTYAVGATDLGVTAVAPNGQLVSVFGDTFASHAVGGTDWRAPVALFGAPSSSGLDGGIVWTGCAGVAQTHADQLVGYTHNSTYNGYTVSTMIPSEIITIGSTMYLQVAAMNGYPTVSYSAIYQSTNNGQTWTAVPGLQWDAANRGGYFQQISMQDGGDGYIYIFATGAQRTKGMILVRAPVATFTTVSTWQDWVYNTTSATWGWSSTVPTTPSVTLAGSFGEHSLRIVEGQWLWSCFDSANYRIDLRQLTTPTADLNSAPVTTLCTGVDWTVEDHSVGKVAQLYGGYIVPGSTLADLHVIVSQWNTSAGWPYRCMEFRRHT